MSEYRLVLPKTAQGGFAESPDQTVGNAGSPVLNQPLTAKNALGIGVAAMYGKKVASAGFQASVGQIGSARLEEAIEIGTKVGGYIGLAVINPVLAGLALVSEVIVQTITFSTETHNQNLENDRTIEARGVRRNYNAGGYYG